ncbi:uncharacterized protein A4U43_C04F28390 [Asparagus officinalis]|uniref:Plant heme peroxidase family profile domain-containing protein n=1 Tax=Asparagus officinalis TaxID=4686 RepID=A0A5P1F4A1_ASPOF|nr:uncharacterized protein A4U43_C04F28390 [Asparagus officinalis]
MSTQPSTPNWLAATLSKACIAGDNTEVAFDASRNSFDNAYFNALQTGDGLLSSDQTLFVSPQTRGFVFAYAMNQARFFFDFQQAMVKMGLIDVKEGNQGDVRLDCRKVN